MRFEYMYVDHVQTREGYTFKDSLEGDIVVKIPSHKGLDILPVLNECGRYRWEFICWDRGRLLFKRSH